MEKLAGIEKDTSKKAEQKCRTLSVHSYFLEKLDFFDCIVLPQV